MALEEQIVEWSAGRPDWQRMVLRRVAGGNPLSDADYDKLVEDLIAESPIEKVAFDLKHVPHMEPKGPQVQLVSIAKPEHVNALASETPLTFTPNSVTVVYGDNGSGKSGYARILKGIARSRHQENVLSDVFRDTTVAKPAADLKVTVGDEIKTVSWPVTNMPELRTMLFYDAPSEACYIDTELDFLYRPPALFVMDGLIQACLAVRSRIDTKLAENADKKKDLPPVDEACKKSDPARFLESLSASSTVKELDDLIAKCNPARIKAAKIREAKLTTADTTDERSRLVRDGAKLDAIATHVADLDQYLGSEAVETLEKQRAGVQALEKAAALLATPFETEPLAGVGSRPWKDLWESARKFSEQHAYPRVPFPVTGTDSRCVLCLQDLRPEAEDRFLRFEEFVKNDTQTKLAAAQNKWTRAVDAVSRLKCSPEAVENNLEDLGSNYAALVAEARALLQHYEEHQTAILEAVRRSTEIPKREFDKVGCGERLKAAATTARGTAYRLEKPEGIEEELCKTVAERTALELLESMKNHRADILYEIQRRMEHGILESVKSSAATTGITKTIAQLSEDHITEVVRDRFTRESQDLKLERITMARTRAEKGSLLHQTRLVGAKQRATVPQVFSEGEKNALGLAAFFTEAELDSSQSAIILDDPVSSLDHIRRRCVARRLASIAVARQVVVFTHDAAFVRNLKQEALECGVTVTERSVCKSRAGDKKPGMCEEKHPWNLKNVKDRLRELGDDIHLMRRESGNWDNDTYWAQIERWAGRMSQILELIVIQEIVDRLVDEGGQEVRTKMLKILPRFTKEDEDMYNASYGRVSGWLVRHEQVTPEVPDMSDLEEELKRVREWWKRIRSYQN